MEKSADVFRQLDEALMSAGTKRVFLVCGNSIKYLKWDTYFHSLPGRLNIKVVRFSDFEVNPDYDSVVRGAKVFSDGGCDCIVACGGGSAIDVAKCIKTETDVPFYAIPTTAGSGSEATHFAVVYQNGEKKSIADESCIPSVVIHDPSVLKTLPDRQRIATLLDAICHSIESLWSLRATPESEEYAQKALQLLWKNAQAYLKRDETTYPVIQQAAYLAGHAINISRTTAGHAMCYKITTLYGMPHGMAAALCVSELWKRMLDPAADCIDPKGRTHLDEKFLLISSCMGLGNPYDAQRTFTECVEKWIPNRPSGVTDDKLDLLATSVNVERLGNHPVYFDRQTLRDIYSHIFT